MVALCGTILYSTIRNTNNDLAREVYFRSIMPTPITEACIPFPIKMEEPWSP